MTHSPAEISWLRLGEAAATPELDALYRRTTEKLGYVRTNQRVTAHRPALALAQDELSRAVNSDRPDGLSTREREFIALTVSVENRCQPCVFGHAAALRLASGDPVWTAKIEVNFRHAALTAREQALADYAVKVTRTPADLVPTDLVPLRNAGLSEIEILDAAAVTAYFNFSNRLNSSLGIVPNTEAYHAHRETA